MTDLNRRWCRWSWLLIEFTHHLKCVESGHHTHFGFAGGAGQRRCLPATDQACKSMPLDARRKPEDADPSWQGMCWRANCNSYVWWKEVWRLQLFVDHRKKEMWRFLYIRALEYFTLYFKRNIILQKIWNRLLIFWRSKTVMFFLRLYQLSIAGWDTLLNPASTD